MVEAAPPTGKAAVQVVDVGQYGSIIEARAYIANVYEDGGKCTVTFLKGNLTVTRTNTAFKDATTTQCGSFSIDRADFAQAGSWEATIKYDSATARGLSDQKEIIIK